MLHFSGSSRPSFNTMLNAGNSWRLRLQILDKRNAEFDELLKKHSKNLEADEIKVFIKTYKTYIYRDNLCKLYELRFKHKFGDNVTYDFENPEHAAFIIKHYRSDEIVNLFVEYLQYAENINRLRAIDKKLFNILVKDKNRLTKKLIGTNNLKLLKIADSSVGNVLHEIIYKKRGSGLFSKPCRPTAKNAKKIRKAIKELEEKQEQELKVLSSDATSTTTVNL